MIWDIYLLFGYLCLQGKDLHSGSKAKRRRIPHTILMSMFGPKSRMPTKWRIVRDWGQPSMFVASHWRTVGA